MRAVRAALTHDLLELWLELDQAGVLCAPEELSLPAGRAGRLRHSRPAQATEVHSLPLSVHSNGKEVVLPRGGVAVQQGDGWVPVVTRVVDKAIETEAVLSTRVQQRPCTPHRVVLGQGAESMSGAM